MNTEDFNIIVSDQLDLVSKMLIKKAGEYATSEDRLHNFRQAAHLGQESMRKALSGMMLKHTVSVYDMVQGEDEYTMDQWKEKITDHIAYLVLLLAVVVEGKNEANSITSISDKEVLISAFKNLSSEQIRNAFREANPLADIDFDSPEVKEDASSVDSDPVPYEEVVLVPKDPGLPDFLKPRQIPVVFDETNEPTSYHPDDINAPTTVMNTIPEEANAN